MAPETPNAYTDGSMLNPRGLHSKRGGLGVWWPSRNEGITKEEGPNFTEDFHVYTLLWNEDCLMMMVDGEKYAGPYSRSTTLPTTWPFDQNFHLLLNVAVGGNLPGNPTPATQFPQTMEVDYVRVFSEK